MPKMNLDPQMRQDFDNMLKLAFPESFAQSMTANVDQASQGFVQAMSSLQQPIAGTAELFSGLPPAITPVSQAMSTLPQPMTDTATAFGTLPQPINDTTGAFGNMLPPANRLPGAFNNIFASATNVSTSLDNVSVKLANWQPPQAQVVSIPGTGPAPATPMFGVPGRAIGGVVERDGFAYVHAGNVITPARATRGLSGFNQLMSLARSQGPATSIVKQFPILPSVAGDTSNASAGRVDSPISLSVVMPPMSQAATPSPFSAAAAMPSSSFRSNTVSDVRRVGNYESRSVTNFADRLTRATSLVSEFSRSKESERSSMRSMLDVHYADEILRSSSTAERLFDRRSETSTTVNFENSIARRSERTSTVSSFVNDLFRSRNESRFRIDEELIRRDADRASARRPERGEERSSQASTPPINVSLNFSPTINAKTITEVEKQLDEQYAIAKKRMLRQVGKSIDNGRLRA